MKEKLEALNELAKTMSKLKADKFKSKKGAPAAEEVCEDEECEEPVDVEVVELEDGEEPIEESEDEEETGPKSFSQILAEVAKSKGKKH